MRPGEILRNFFTKDGREVILRAVQWEDLDDLLDFINSFAEEDLEFLPRRVEMTRNEEADWLSWRLAAIEKGDIINVLAEVDGKIVGNSEVKLLKGVRSHMGEIGIRVRYGYRDLGIGTKMMKTLIEESRKAGLKVLILRTFENNNRAKHVYEKVGFVETGRIPRGVYRKDEYIDEIIMSLDLERYENQNQKS